MTRWNNSPRKMVSSFNAQWENPANEILDIFAGLAMHALLQKSNLAIARDMDSQMILSRQAYNIASVMMHTRAHWIDSIDHNEE